MQGFMPSEVLEPFNTNNNLIDFEEKKPHKSNDSSSHVENLNEEVLKYLYLKLSFSYSKTQLIIDYELVLYCNLRF